MALTSVLPREMPRLLVRSGQYDWLLKTIPSPVACSVAENACMFMCNALGWENLQPVFTLSKLGSFYKYMGFETGIHCLKVFCLCIIWFLVHCNRRLTDMITDNTQLFVCVGVYVY